ncbi:hypothetical protein [Chryseobacterium gregarium]|nr:hypothetical protein [Chryseobacterium gregarium]
MRTPISYPWVLIRIKTVINFENLSVKTGLLKESASKKSMTEWSACMGRK